MNDIISMEDIKQKYKPLCEKSEVTEKIFEVTECAMLAMNKGNYKEWKELNGPTRKCLRFSARKL